jgi:hypothetical protein
MGPTQFSVTALRAEGGRLSIAALAISNLSLPLASQRNRDKCELRVVSRRTLKRWGPFPLTQLKPGDRCL